MWRRWTGIEPAGRGSPVPAALKAVEPTRCPDTSGGDPTDNPVDEGVRVAAMKKILVLLVVVGLVALAAKKVRTV